ncbi:flavin reductase [Raoultibacter phocaeensis]|uniref:flavin reductase n=1 Tax=Raoultibacter phocaeensis TaxID=2479841 RepID=UPI00111874DD|nr:flavin reductase [Raoultibacter phocaeensis]
MLDTNAFRSISYGLYLVSSYVDGKAAGCTVNTFAQVTSDPLQVSVAINKENHTASVICEAGMYTAVSLSQNASMELIGRFGFFCSRDVDKFESYSVQADGYGFPYIAEQTVARFTVQVSDSIDLGTHLLFIGTVIEAEILSDDKPMTYAYYHSVKGGKTPPKASSYLGETAEASETPRIAWRCTVCGHIEEVDELPEDFICPVCGVGRELFERIEL